MTTVLDVGDACTHQILGYLSGLDCAVVSCASKYWRGLLALDSLWQQRCAADYHQTTLTSLTGSELPSFRAAYGERHAADRRYPEHFRRAASMWATVERWLAREFPPVLHSLAPGATEAELDAAERTLGCELPPALRAIYRVHNGQALRFDASFDAAQGINTLDGSDPTIMHGLFGGYLVYNQLACTRLLPLHRLVRYTRLARHHHHLLGPHHVIVAASYLLFDKFFAVDATTCALFYNRPAHPAHPPSPAPDGALRWMETFAARLAAGTYILSAPLTPSHPYDPTPALPSPYLSIFPVTPPMLVTAVTRGVRVQASCSFIPGDKPGVEEYFYSIRMCLLPAQQQSAGPSGRPLASVQLSSRFWRIRDGDAPEQVVSGDGVIGEHPLLLAGGEEFVYQSRTETQHGSGYMEGHFMFVEGSLQQPTGPEFAAACPRFDLKRPEYLY